MNIFLTDNVREKYEKIKIKNCCWLVLKRNRLWSTKKMNNVNCWLFSHRRESNRTAPWCIKIIIFHRKMIIIIVIVDAPKDIYLISMISNAIALCQFSSLFEWKYQWIMDELTSVHIKCIFNATILLCANSNENLRVSCTVELFQWLSSEHTVHSTLTTQSHPMQLKTSQLSSGS